jgi:hypothetical protein
MEKELHHPVITPIPQHKKSYSALVHLSIITCILAATIYHQVQQPVNPVYVPYRPSEMDTWSADTYRMIWVTELVPWLYGLPARADLNSGLMKTAKLLMVSQTSMSG